MCPAVKLVLPAVLIYFKESWTFFEIQNQKNVLQLCTYSMNTTIVFGKNVFDDFVIDLLTKYSAMCSTV